MTLKKIAEFYAGVARAEHLHEPQGPDDEAYDIAISHCAAAIRTATLPTELVAEIERDRRDAQRYRWLRDEGDARRIQPDTPSMCEGRGPYIHLELPSLNGCSIALSGRAADSIIDAIAGKEG